MPAPVGSGFANTGTAQNPETLTVTMAAGREAVAGNLLVAAANSDFTMPTPTGYTLAVTASDSQVMHIWYKIAAGGETSVTFNSDSPFRPMSGALLEYEDVDATPLDKTASATRSGSSSASQATGTTAATVQADELIVVAVGPHSYLLTPSGASWSNSYTNRGGDGTTNLSTSTRCALFVGDKTVAATGTQTSTCTWTNNSDDAGGAIATFKLTAGDATASPAVCALTMAVPAPTLSAGSTPTPAATALTLAVPAPTLSAGSTPTPATAALTVAAPAVTTSAGATTSPAVAALVMTIPAVSATGSGDATASPATVALLLAAPAVTPSAGSTTSPAAVALVMAVPAPTLSAGASASPAAVALILAAPAASLSAGATASPAVVALVLSMPSVSTGDVRNLVWIFGRPRAKWLAGKPEGKWVARKPQAKWTAGKPQE